MSSVFKVVTSSHCVRALDEDHGGVVLNIALGRRVCNSFNCLGKVFSGQLFLFE